MATILVLAHEHDRFHARSFMIQALFPHWIEAGHQVVVHEGTRRVPAADVGVLHVDRTVVPPDYVAAVASCRVGVNLGAVDIGKRTFSPHVVADRAHPGPVIVKTNRNAGGYPEVFHWHEARRAGKAVDDVPRYMPDRYPVYRSASLVPEAAWTDPDLVVERFLPERDERGYYLRTWTFFGDRERCSRVLAAHPVIKAADVLERVLVPVPDALRAWRTRLGFDYGKFDFVERDGEVVLFDVNRTPTIPANLSAALSQGMADLAKGIEALL